MNVQQAIWGGGRRIVEVMGVGYYLCIEGFGCMESVTLTWSTASYSQSTLK